MNAQVEAQRQKDRARLAQLQAQHHADQKRLQELLRQLDSQDNAKRIAELQAELAEYRLKEEDLKVEKWKDRFKNHRGCLQFVTLLAREAHPLDALSIDSAGTPA